MANSTNTDDERNSNDTEKFSTFLKAVVTFKGGRKRDEKRRQDAQLTPQNKVTALLLAVVYGCFIFCRNFAIVISASLKNDSNLGFTNSSAGQLAVVVGVSHGLGAVFCGALIDHFNTKVCYMLSMVVTIICTIWFSFVSNFDSILLVSVINSFFQAFGWPASVKLIYEWFEPAKHGTVFSFLGIGSRVGSILASAILGAILTQVSWRNTVRISSLFTVGGLLITIFLRPHTQPIAPTSTSTPISHASPKEELNKGKPTKQTKCTNIFVVIFSIFKKNISWFADARFTLMNIGHALYLVIGMFETFISLWINDTVGSSESTSGMMVSTISIGIIISILGGGFFLEKESSQTRARLILLLGLGLIGTCLGILIWTSTVVTNGCSNEGVCLATAGVLIILLGLCDGYLWYIPANVFAIKFGKEESATVTSNYKIVGAIFAAGYAYGAASLSDTEGGWVYLWFLIFIISIVAFILYAWFYYLNLKEKGEELLVLPDIDVPNVEEIRNCLEDVADKASTALSMEHLKPDEQARGKQNLAEVKIESV